MTDPPLLQPRQRRAERRLAGWPALAGLVAGALLVLRLRSLDDRLLTRDVQSLLLVVTLTALVSAALLAALGVALRRATGGRWWLAPALLAWWVATATVVAGSAVGFWLVATTGSLRA